MGTPSIRSVPMLWIGLSLVCLGVLVWIGSVGFFMSSAISRLDASMPGPPRTMWPLMVGYAASAICVLSGLVMMVMGFIQYSHLFRANIDAADRNARN